IGHHAFMDDIEEWITWGAKNKLNTLFVHVTADKPALGAATEEQCQSKKAHALDSAEKYGVIIEHGGHGLSHFVPRKEFKKSPELFRFDGEKRTKDHNFCPNNTKDSELFRKRAREHFLSHPRVDVFHVYPDDIPGGGWCQCDQCKDYSPSEQQLMAINTAAEELEKVNPEASLVHIAYHDTEEVPEKVIPRNNVSLLWAPRRRCYAHSLNEANCQINNYFSTNIGRNIDQFKEKKPPRVFEYYLDAILFKSLLPPLPTVMQEDLRFYRDKGVHTVQALMTGDRKWITPQLNAWLFARLSWNPDQDLVQLLREFSRVVFKNNSDLTEYYRSLERAFALALDMVSGQNVLRFETDQSKTFDSPPVDMADPYGLSLEHLDKKVRANEEILELISQAEKSLLCNKNRASDESWDREFRSFKLTKAWLLFDLSRVRLYHCISKGTNKELVKKAVKEVETAINEVFNWGKENIADSRYEKNFRFIHFVFWQIRVNQIKASETMSLPFRVLLKIKTLVQLGVLFIQVRRLY
ncbi:MAG: DUF4838 domain-containing protein, partial [Candidatus Hodarchaeales archaeon]